MFAERLKVLPFWSTREKSGAVSPTLRFRAVDWRVVGAAVKADAEAAVAAMRAAVNFMVSNWRRET